MKLSEKQNNNLYDGLVNINGINDVEIETSGDDENWPINAVSVWGRGGYNVDWCDREGRHPYAEFELDIDLEELSYKVKGVLWYHDETSERTGQVKSIDDLANAINGDISDICHEIDA